MASPPRWKPENVLLGTPKRSQDRRATCPQPLFWHAKHAQNAHAKIEPDTIGNGIIRDESRLHAAPHVFDRDIGCEIALLRFLKESTLMVGATHRTVIFDGEQAMPEWSRHQHGIRIHDAARRTDTTIMFGRSLASKLRLA